MRPRLSTVLPGLVLIPALAGATSVFSAWGVGEVTEGANTRVRALGGLALAVPSEGRPSFHNPASLVGVPLACLSVNLSPEVTWVESDEGHNRLISTALPTLDLAMPLGLGCVGWLGLRQVTAVGYEAEREDELDGTEFTRRLSREGGISAVAAGGAWGGAEWLSVGVEARFLFGRILEQRILDFSGSLYDDTQDELTSAFRGTVWRLGAIIRPHPRLRIGGMLGTPRDLRVSYETMNTVGVETSWSGYLRFPAALGAGVAVSPWGPITFSADWMETRWGATRFEQTGETFENTTSVGLGIEVAAARGQERGFFRQFPLRLGYARHPWYTGLDGDARPEETRYSIGTSVPLLGRRGFVDLTVEYGLREASGVREKLLRFQFGAVGFERWARKYD
jgi:hypothetical protein